MKKLIFQPAPEPPKIIPIGNVGSIKPYQFYCSLSNFTIAFSCVTMALVILWTIVGWDKPVHQSDKSDWFGTFVTTMLSILLVLTLVFFAVFFAYARPTIFDVNHMNYGMMMLILGLKLIFVLGPVILALVNTTTSRQKRGDGLGLATVVVLTLSMIVQGAGGWPCETSDFKFRQLYWS